VWQISRHAKEGGWLAPKMGECEMVRHLAEQPEKKGGEGKCGRKRSPEVPVGKKKRSNLHFLWAPVSERIDFYHDHQPLGKEGASGSLFSLIGQRKWIVSLGSKVKKNYQEEVSEGVISTRNDGEKRGGGRKEDWRGGASSQLDRGSTVGAKKLTVPRAKEMEAALSLWKCFNGACGPQ